MFSSSRPARRAVQPVLAPLALLLSLPAAAQRDSLFSQDVCERPWNDTCPGGGPSCTPFAPPLAQPTDWRALRAALRNVVFGRADGALPATGADAAELLGGRSGRGCWCSALGNCNASLCTWPANITRLTFTTAAAFPNGSLALALNSTVYYTLNTSGVAPITYPSGGPPLFPDFPSLPQRGGTLVLFHNGHNQPCNDTSTTDDDNTVDYLNQLGYDVMSFNMPLYATNFYPPSGGCDHRWFAQFERAGVPTMRFFLEPVVRAVNFALGELGYDRVAMTGLSGGGWTTTLAAALDARIGLAMPVAGSMPCDFHHTAWDYEQLCNASWAMVANYTSLYVLGGLEANKTLVQINHEKDPCCFHGCTRHDRIRTYNAFVRSQTAGRFATCVTQGNAHEVNPRDKVVIGSLLDKWRMSAGGALAAADVDELPFNTMREW